MTSCASAAIPTIQRATAPRRLEYAVFVQGEDELARSICSLVAVAINNIKTLYDEKHDKATFVKNIILDNILPGDIYIKSRELHFGNDVPRVVFLVAPADAGRTWPRSTL